MATEITQGVTEAVEATGGIAALGINAKLLLAQLIHFGIVLLIFWKWIYGPVKAMLQKRQETIEKSLEDAKLFEERLTKLEKDRVSVIGQAKQEAALLLETTHKQSEEQKKKMLEKTKAEVAMIIAEGKQQLQNEKTTMLHETKNAIAELAVEIARKVLTETIDQDVAQKKAQQAIKDVFGS